MSGRMLAARIIPVRFPQRAGAVVLRNLMVYRYIWIIIVSGFFEPLFYLFAVRVGIGELVGNVRDGNGDPVTYAAFVAPALLAASAMNGGMFESTNIFFKLRYGKVYDAMLATPVGPFDIALGEIAWALVRGAIYSVGFILVVWVTGLTVSPLAALALPASLLVGFAFAAVGAAATTFMRSWQDFDLVNLSTLVLFLFSATFYPVDVYPPAIQVVAHLSPLYHGVELIRSLMLGTVGPGILVNLGVLAALGWVALQVTAARMAHVLTP